MAQTVVVTGASKANAVFHGLGLAISRYLISNGHNVVVTARSKELLEELHAAAPKQVRILSGDVCDHTLGKKVADLATAEFGGVNSLIINHGAIAPVERIADANVEDWKKQFDINFFSAVSFLKAFLPSLRQSKGRIIFTSSGAALHSYSGWGPYCASKAALKSLGETLCLEEKDVTTVSVAPGIVDTDMQKDMREKHLAVLDEKDQKRFGQAKKEGKLLKPEQPGDVIARLSLEASQDLSGKMLNWNSDELASYRD